MKRFLLALMALGLLGLATQAPAACRWFGTQVECDLGGSQLTIGTQRVPEPTCARAFGRQLETVAGKRDDGPARPGRERRGRSAEWSTGRQLATLPIA